MNDSQTLIPRRRFMTFVGAGTLTVSLIGLLHSRAAPGQDKPKVDLNDPVAKALAYVHESTTEGQTCKNCKIYQGGDAEWGGCPIFQGKSVAAKGWCKSWVTKST